VTIAEDAVMTTYFDEQEEGVRTIVLRGPVALCAYLGVPEGHPLAGNDYDDLSLDVHGWLTYAGTFKEFPGWYFYGWDYAHVGDKMLRDREIRAILGDDRGKEWTPTEVIEEARAAQYDFRRLVRLAEKIARRGSPSPDSGKQEER
jgi:hypothetical protein